MVFATKVMMAITVSKLQQQQLEARASMTCVGRLADNPQAVKSAQTPT